MSPTPAAWVLEDGVVRHNTSWLILLMRLSDRFDPLARLMLPRKLRKWWTGTDAKVEVVNGRRTSVFLGDSTGFYKQGILAFLIGAFLEQHSDKLAAGVVGDLEADAGMAGFVVPDVIKTRILSREALIITHDRDIRFILGDDKAWVKGPVWWALRGSLGNALFTGINNNLWAELRPVVRSVFHHKIRPHIKLANTEAQELVARISGQLVDANNTCGLHVFRSVIRAAFGFYPDDPVDQLVAVMVQGARAASRAVSTSPAMFLPPQAPSPTRTGPRGSLIHSIMIPASKMLRRWINRVAAGEGDPDSLISWYLRINLAGGDVDKAKALKPPFRVSRKLMHKTMQLVQPILGGAGTATQAFTWMVLELARHPERQADLRQEIRSVMVQQRDKHGDVISDATVNRMKKLSLFLRECERLYPPIWATARYATKDVPAGTDYFGGRAIKKGSVVFPVSLLAHRRADVWGPDAEMFRPERFNDGQCPGILSFGAGDRHCSGRNFANAFIRMSVAYMLTDHYIEFDPALSDKDIQQAARPDESILLAPSGAFSIRLVPI